MDAELEEQALSGDHVEAKGSVRGHLILAEVVSEALSKHKQGKATDYYAIIEHLSVAQMKPVVMQRWLQGLSLCVSKITKDHSQLVAATLKFTWYDKDPDTVNLYIEYLTSLLSAQTHYLNSVLLTLTRRLWVGPVDCVEGGNVLENIHRAIRAVLEQTPLATSLLMPFISKNYPFKGKSVEIQELALRNVLYMSMYCPTLREDILELVVHKMLTIDVELPSLEEEGEEEEGDETQFHVELDSSADDCVAIADSAASLLELTYSNKHVMKNEQAEKLDVMMATCMDHLHMICHHKDCFNLDIAGSLLSSLLRVFEHILLPTHACSHVQFLLFNFTSLHMDFPGYFLDFLWKKFQDPNTPAILRQTTAAYIASYVARSKSVSLETTKCCITVIMQWIHQYLDSVSFENLKPDLRQHGPFYSLCQAGFYIFTFRHKSLVEMERGMEFLRQLNFERIITSRLNPLKVCLPAVVDMFASLANQHQVAFSYTILEQNKRLILSSSSSSSSNVPSGHATGSPKQQNLLDCFFPFDPYQLKRSGKYISPLYEQWEDPTEGAEDLNMEDDDDHTSMASSLSFRGHSLTTRSIGSDCSTEF